MNIKFIIFIYILFPLSLSSQIKIEEYLIVNKSEDISKLAEFIGNDSKKYSIFFAGERHDKAGSRLLELQTFKELYFRNNVRYFIFEYSEFIAGIMNDYIQSGNQDKLEQFLYYCYNPKIDSKLFLIELRTFWMQLPESEKFQIIGIDVNQY